MNEIFEKVLIKVKKTIKTSTLKTNYKDRAKISRSKNLTSIIAKPSKLKLLNHTNKLIQFKGV